MNKLKAIWLFLVAGTLTLVGVSCEREEIKPVPKDIPVTAITLNTKSATLHEGEEIQLTATVEPANATDKSLSWKSSSPAFATVDEHGLVKGIREGSSSIRVKSADGTVGVVCQITVLKAIPPTIAVTGVSISHESVEIQRGKTLQLEATVSPDNADVKEVNWETDDAAIATVEDGLVTGRNPGTTRITVKTVDGGFAAFCKVTVTQEPDPVQGDRWTDTGADLADYPSYSPVSSLSDFPRIDITTTQSIQHRVYCSGKISFKDPKSMYGEETNLTDLSMQIKGRGNTTWNAEGGIKNPYRIKLDQHTRIFGMKGDKDWILLSDVQDPTLLRNAVALRISRMVSMPWTPKYRAAEVYLNGSYQGCYLLVEAKEADRENKVPITPVLAMTTETDGGYLLEIDDKPDSDHYFKSSSFGKKIKYKEPESPTTAQKNFIESYVNKVEKKLKNKEFSGDDSYKDYVELGTFINQYIVQEVTMNVDGNMRLSTYFAKDKDTKLFMPMVWDFDLALGNCTYIGKEFDLPYYDGSRDGPKGWFIKIRGGYPDENKGKKDTYYQYMFQDPEFVQELKARWNQVKPRLDKIPAFIDQMYAYNTLAYAHNSQAGKNPRGNRGWYYPPDNFNNQKEAVDWLKNWYTQRLAWLDTEINNL